MEQINHPEYYEKNGYEAIDYIEAHNLNFNLGNVVKYVTRAGYKSGYVPHEVLGRIIKAGHESILEHITLTYSVKGISRALLQELARHRHMSLSVESTRHTLKKQLANEQWIESLEDKLFPCQRDLLYHLVKLAKISDYGNDKLKYYLPEFWPTNLILTSNIRELRHIIKLRTAPAALKEFQDLARALFDAVPDNFKYLLKDCVYKEGENKNPAVCDLSTLQRQLLRSSCNCKTCRN